jgi:hypothetical protein
VVHESTLSSAQMNTWKQFQQADHDSKYGMTASQMEQWNKFDDAPAPKAEVEAPQAAHLTATSSSIPSLGDDTASTADDTATSAADLNSAQEKAFEQMERAEKEKEEEKEEMERLQKEHQQDVAKHPVVLEHPEPTETALKKDSALTATHMKSFRKGSKPLHQSRTSG